MVQGASRFGSFRRTAFVGACAASAVLATFATSTGTSGAQSAGFNNGTGSALATSMKINPVAGGLSFGMSAGESLAGHQNTVATAESRAVNTGVIGVTLGAQGCDGGDPTLPKEDQPQPVRTSTGEEGADAGISNQDPKVPGVNRTVRATAAPYAESITSAEGLDIPGVLTIGPTIARASSGVFDGYREALAVSEVSSITFAGTVTMSGLRWEAFHRTGSREEVGGSFTIGSATGPLGIPIPTDDPVATLAQANTLLAPFGLEIRPPTYHLDTTSSGTLATVDPIAIALVPGPLRDSIIQPVISGAQPVRDALFDAMIEADCSTASGITVLDVLLSSTGPGGRFALELGGVQAATAAITLFSGLGQLPPLSPVTPASGSTGSTTGSVARPTTGSAATPARPSAPATPAAASSPDNPIDDAIDAVAAEGERGGPLLAVGLGGLGALLLAAEGDRRKMRRAQREIPLEA